MEVHSQVSYVELTRINWRHIIQAWFDAPMWPLCLISWHLNALSWNFKETYTLLTHALLRARAGVCFPHCHAKLFPNFHKYLDCLHSYNSIASNAFESQSEHFKSVKWRTHRVSEG